MEKPNQIIVSAIAWLLGAGLLVSNQPIEAATNQSEAPNSQSSTSTLTLATALESGLSPLQAVKALAAQGSLTIRDIETAIATALSQPDVDTGEEDVSDAAEILLFVIEMYPDHAAGLIERMASREPDLMIDTMVLATVKESSALALMVETLVEYAPELILETAIALANTAPGLINGFVATVDQFDPELADEAADVFATESNSDGSNTDSTTEPENRASQS